MSNKPLDAAWKAWLKENMARRCDPRELTDILLKHRFSIESIRECMGPMLIADSHAARRATGKQLDPSWKGWVEQNIDRGCDAPALVDILVKNHFSLDAIADAMGSSFPGDAQS